MEAATAIRKFGRPGGADAFRLQLKDGYTPEVSDLDDGRVRLRLPGAPMLGDHRWGTAGRVFDNRDAVLDFIIRAFS
jgi:hypothetical protein